MMVKSSNSGMGILAWPWDFVILFLIFDSCHHGLSSNPGCSADSVGKRWQLAQKHIFNTMKFGLMHQASSPISYKQGTEMTVSYSNNSYRELLCWQVKSSRSSYFQMPAFYLFKLMIKIGGQAHLTFCMWETILFDIIKFLLSICNLLSHCHLCS